MTPPTPVTTAAGWDLPGLRRRIAHQQRITPTDEQTIHKARHLVIQPSLDQARWRLWGELPALDGAIVEQALTTRADTHPQPPNGTTEPRAARMADALTTICHDSLHPPQNGHDRPAGSVPLVTIFVDATHATPTNAETGITLQTGPRIGPQALQAILCDTITEVTATTKDGTPLGIGTRSRTIPPRLRRYILARDQTCTTDGCQSRYRLQPHHITWHATTGNHDPNNLTTLCWYHHHNLIHGHGYTIDPTSPPQRRRLQPPTTTNPP